MSPTAACVFALDVLHAGDGTEVIIEIPPSANGLMCEFSEGDCKRIGNSVVAKGK